MTQYSDPFEQRFGGKIRDLEKRLAAAEQHLASATGGAVPCTAATHPANPATGMRIYETDTDLEAYWNGSSWVYPPQQIAKTVLGGTASSIPLTVPTGPAFTTLRVAWTGRSTSAGTADYMCLQLNGDTASTSYLWEFNQSNVAADSSTGSGGTVNHIRVGTIAGSAATSGYLGGGGFEIPNAAGSTFKVASSFSNSQNAANNGFSGTYGGLWVNSSAVASITLFALSGSLAAGSSATLYGET